MAFSEVPEDKGEDMTLGNDCSRMMVKVGRMEKLPESVWAKEGGVIFLC